MTEVILFAGTTEGRHLAEYLDRCGKKTFVCVATEYGEALLQQSENIVISKNRLDQSQMEELFSEQKPKLVIDATHPYAVEVTENIKAACMAKELHYLRILRESEEIGSDAVYVDSVREAVNYLKQTTGTVLVTTGSKNLDDYCQIQDYRNRLFIRVLPSIKVIEDCERLGWKGQNLICMQGPFSVDLNVALLKQINASYLITKESGSAGGFAEKYKAARLANATLIVIGRPEKETGSSVAQAKQIIREILGNTAKKKRQKIYAIGIGPGAKETLTLEADAVLKKADLIIGAGRMLQSVLEPHQKGVTLYKAEEIAQYIQDHTEYDTVAIAYSGDIGFCSGARQLSKYLPDVHYISGISSVMYFAAKLKVPWENAVFLSLHGKSCNIIGALKETGRVFCLIGTTTTVSEICKRLVFYHMDSVTVAVGERLSYFDERIRKGKPEDFIDEETQTLSVLYLEFAEEKSYPILSRVEDRHFLRGQVPMTKEEIRTLSVSKLSLKRDSIVYDIGAGTGSVSVQMALQCIHGQIYAIEQKKQAAALVLKNKQRFQTENLIVIEGSAPDSLETLPVPTHAFIGGTSGSLKEILQVLLQKNPEIRIVITAITLETMAQTIEIIRQLPITEEVIQVSVSRARSVGMYHMMTGENPVYIITCQGVKNENI